MKGMSIRHRILDMHLTGMLEWLEKLKVQVDMNSRKKPYVTEVGMLLRWLKKGECDGIRQGRMGAALLDGKNRKYW